MPQSPSKPAIPLMLSNDMIATAVMANVKAQPVFTHFATADLNLVALRLLTVDENIKNAPVVSAPPVLVTAALSGANGKQYFVPMARVARRSKASSVKHVFLERRDGKVVLRVFVELVRASAIPAEAIALPVDKYTVTLVGSGNRKVHFTRCDELPPTDKPVDVIAQLLCEAEVDPNQVVSLLQDDPTTRFEVHGTVHYGLTGATQPAPKPKRPRRRRPRRRNSVGAAVRARGVKPKNVIPPQLLTSILAKPIVMTLLPNQWTSQTTPPVQTSKRLSLGAPSGTDLAAHFPTSVAENRMIYAQVTSGFGTEPWSTWARGQEGHFTDSPVPDQFYILPDEYRLTFEIDTGMPSMMVMLVAPEAAADTTADVSATRDYKIRCRFSVVPYVDPARRERLRAEIKRHSGVAHPDLIVGGVASATCELSRVYASLGTSVVGTNETTVGVDALGFDLVLDCTSQFYASLSSLLIAEGLAGDVVVQLLDSSDSAKAVTIPLKLALNRPAIDFLGTELIVPSIPEPPQDAASLETGTATEQALPARPITLRITNPVPYQVTIAEVRPTLLVTDPSLPSPIGAVATKANPTTCILEEAVDGVATSVDIELSTIDTALPQLFGAVAVGFVGAIVEIDADALLNRIHDAGTSTDLSTSITMSSYQLDHPDVLPDSHQDVFGIEAQVRRDESDPITVFLTRDEPLAAAEVAFTLKDVLAGATPEQPTFSWRRRNLAGSGTSEWSDWDTITGRRLLISPVGL